MNDILRAIYYEIWLALGLSNKYRYEHFIKKLDCFYEYEKIKIALNPQGKNQNSQTLNYLHLFKFISSMIE